MKKKKIVKILILIILILLLFGVGLKLLCIFFEKTIPKAAENIFDLVDLDVIESNLKDSDYYETVELAMLADAVENPDYAYAYHIDQIIFQQESEKYLSIYYYSSKDENHGCLSWMKFRKKQFGNITKYASLKLRFNTELTSEQAEDKVGKAVLKMLEESGQYPLLEYTETLEGSVHMQLTAPEMMQQTNSDVANVYPGEKRFLYGDTQDERIYDIRVEGQAPTGVIPYEVLGEKWYFFYFEDFDSDKPANEFVVTLETKT